MKRSLLVAALALTFTPFVWAADPASSTATDGAMLVQQMQQTALLASINDKLNTPPTSSSASDAAVKSLGTDQGATFYGDQTSTTIPARLTDRPALATSQVMVTIDIFKTNAAGVEQRTNHYSILTNNGQPSHLFSGETIPYTAAATTALDKDGKPIPPTVKTLDIGTTIVLDPRVVNKDHALLRLDLSQSRLISLQSFDAGNGLKVDLPSTHETASSQSMSLKVGQSATLTGSEPEAEASRVVVKLDSIESYPVATQASR